LGYRFEQQKNDKEALSYYESGCTLGDAPSCVNGGGLAFTQNKKEQSTQLYRIGCQLGDPKACSTLGLLYLRGQGTQINISNAHRLLTIGCAAQITTACDALYNEFPLHAMSSCKTGAAESCYFAAQQQEKRNPEDARTFAQTGCDQGAPLSCVKFGYYLLSGIGGTIDRQQAQTLFTQSCAKEEGAGCFNMGLMGIEDDAPPASISRYFVQACTHGDPRGCVQGGQRFKTSDVSQSKSLFEKGCTLLDGGSCTMLGNMIISINPQQSYALYNKGCALGYAEACFNQAVSLYKGLGTEKSPTGVQQLMERACTLGSTEACSRKSSSK
jgi:TPR repeat protein